METRIQELELRGEPGYRGELHWRPSFGSSPILAVAGVPLSGGVAAEDEIVSAAQCLGWRLVDSCAEPSGACALRLCRPVVLDLRPG